MIERIGLSIARLALAEIEGLEWLEAVVTADIRQIFTQHFRYQDFKYALDIKCEEQNVLLSLSIPEISPPVELRFAYGVEAKKLSEINFGCTVKHILMEHEDRDLPFESPTVCPMVREAMLVYIPHRIVDSATNSDRKELYHISNLLSEWLSEKEVNFQTLSRRLFFDRIAWLSAGDQKEKRAAFDRYYRTSILRWNRRQTDSNLPLNPDAMDRSPLPTKQMASNRLDHTIMNKYGSALRETSFMMFVRRMRLDKEFGTMPSTDL